MNIRVLKSWLPKSWIPKWGPLALGLSIPMAFAAFSPSLAQEQVTAGPPQQVLLTLYADGIAVVEERRSVVLPGGPAELTVDGLPEGMLSNSVSLEANGIPAVDLKLGRNRIDQARLLALSLGKTIEWVVPDAKDGTRTYRGRLVAYRNGIVIRDGEMLKTLPPGQLFLNEVPEGLSEGSWISGTVSSEIPGDQLVRLGYLTPGIGWSVDYEARLNAEETALVLDGRYAIANGLDRSFPNATTRLVAGSVNRAALPRPQVRKQQAVMMEMAVSRTMSSGAPAAPVEAALGDLHVYDLNSALDVPASATVRRALFQPTSLPVEKRYKLQGRGDGWAGRTAEGAERQRPMVSLRFENTADGPLARPLPAGLVRVFGALPSDDEDSPRVVLGEARIGHKAVGETVDLPLGQAFDVTVERRMTYFRQDPDDNQRRNRGLPFETAHEITFHNARDRAVTVELRERFSGDWKIINASIDPADRRPRSGLWKIKVPAGGKTVLSYRVRIEP